MPDTFIISPKVPRGISREYKCMFWLPNTHLVENLKQSSCESIIGNSILRATLGLHSSDKSDSFLISLLNLASGCCA